MRTMFTFDGWALLAIIAWMVSAGLLIGWLSSPLVILVLAFCLSVVASIARVRSHKHLRERIGREPR